MATSLPRLTLVSVGSDRDAAARLGARLALGLSDAGFGVVALSVGADRDAPTPEAVRGLARATGRAVHRLDARLMPAPSLQSVVCRVAGGLDCALLVSGETLEAGGAFTGEVFDAAVAVGGPVVLAVDATEGGGQRGPVAARVAAVARAAARALGGNSDRIVIALSEPPGPRRAPVVERATGLEVVEVGPRDAALSEHALARLVDRARSAAPLPPPPLHRRRHVRARVGLVLDECFDLYDEEGLVQFEVAGAEIVPLSALEGGALPELDGLIIGDGRVERHSDRLAAASRFRASVREHVASGLPTLASGGGLAYLGRGLRTISGALHPFVGALDAEAVVLGESLPRGHVEVESTTDTLIGPRGTRVSGYVQRGWLLRGLPHADRGAYRVLRGKRDEGAARANLLGLHLRPYWPSCPRAGLEFVDRCVAFAVARDRAASTTGDDPTAP